MELIDKEINESLLKGAIQISENEDGEFISNIFLVKKKNGKFRPVINLRKLNSFIEYHHLKQETLEYILKSVGKNYFFTSLDLSDVYFSVPIHTDHHKYLKFYWKCQLIEFTCLPFGISSALRVKSSVFSHKKFRNQLIFYIDDSLLQSHCFN